MKQDTDAKHTIEGYKGTTIVEISQDPDKFKVQYSVKIEKFEHAKVDRLITAYCKKELAEYTKQTAPLMRYESDRQCYTLTIHSLDGLRAIIETILPFLRQLDVFLFYSLMDLGSLGEHYSIIRAAIREQRQWHWLDKEPTP